MARFDVHQYNSKSVPLVVVVQSEFFDGLASRVVIPLAPESDNKGEALPKLKPVIKIRNKNYILRTTDIAAVNSTDLGKFVTNIEDRHRQTITEAIDFLLQGF